MFKKIPQIPPADDQPNFEHSSHLDIEWPEKSLVDLRFPEPLDIDKVILARTQEYDSAVAALLAERDEKIRRKTEQLTRDYSSALATLKQQFDVDIGRLRIIYVAPVVEEQK
jgi:hypothetical protein